MSDVELTEEEAKNVVSAIQEVIDILDADGKKNSQERIQLNWHLFHLEKQLNGGQG